LEFLQCWNQFYTVLDTHLTFEEAFVLPNLSGLFTAKEQIWMEEQVVKATPVSTLPKFIPWLSRYVTAEEFASFIPLPIRKLNDWFWKPIFEKEYALH
jgi:hypothetical protein